MSIAVAPSGPPDWRDFEQPTVPALLQSAVETFVEHGYHGSNMRTLAAHAGLSVPGLYHHYDSKQAIIVAIMERAMEDLYERSLAALDEGDTVQSKTRLQVECLVLFHAHRGNLAFLAASEIRSLENEARERHIAARDRQQRILLDLVERGVAEGAFSSDDPRGTTRAIITMCTGVSQWFHLGGPVSPETVAAEYVEMAMRILATR